MADSPGPLGQQEAELAERLGKTEEASSDDLQKDPVLSSFLDELSGRVSKRSIAEYEGKMQSVSTPFMLDCFADYLTEVCRRLKTARSGGIDSSRNNSCQMPLQLTLSCSTDKPRAV